MDNAASSSSSSIIAAIFHDAKKSTQPLKTTIQEEQQQLHQPAQLQQQLQKPLSIKTRFLQQVATPTTSVIFNSESSPSSSSSESPTSMAFLVRDTIAQYWPLFITVSVIIIYLTYYFTRVSKKPKLIGQRNSKFVEFIEENLKKSVQSRFSPLMYFWGANAQTALFGYLQGRKSLSDEQRDFLVKRQYIYVSDVQYLTSNKDLSKYYESIRTKENTNNNNDNDKNKNDERHIKLQLRVAANLQNQQHKVKLQHDAFHLNRLQNGDDSGDDYATYRNESQQHENIRLALEQHRHQQDDAGQMQPINLDVNCESNNKLIVGSSPPIRLGCEGGVGVGVGTSCSCSSASSSSDSGVFGTHAGNSSGQASCISSGSSSGHSSSSSRASTSSLHVLPSQQQHQEPAAQSAAETQTATTTTTTLTTTTRITTTTTTTQTRRREPEQNSLSLEEDSAAEDYLTWVDHKTQQPTVITITNNTKKNHSRKIHNGRRKTSQNNKRKLTLFDVYSANKQLDKERLEFGQCALDWFVSSHKNYHKNKLVALISAGMTSGSDRGYVTETVKTLEGLGYECCVFIRRGVGGLKLSSAKFFSPAKWRDFEAAVQSVRQQRPEARLVAVGFSFGSIELCRYLAMSGQSSHIDSALLVSCPFDPVCGGENMHNGSYLNRRIDAYLAKNLGKQLYEAMFATPLEQSPASSCSNLSSLDSDNFEYNENDKQTNKSPGKQKSSSNNNKNKSILVIKKLDKIKKMTRRKVVISGKNNDNNNAQQMQQQQQQQIWTNENGSSINLASLPKLKSLHDFEYGFNRIVQHYPTREAYAQDCELDLSTIAVPTLCLSSEDDFMAPKHLLPIEQVEANPNMCMLLTKRGGHMAFVDGLVWPKKPYFAQRIIGDYMGALRNKFMQQQHQQQQHNSISISTLSTTQPNEPSQPAPHIAIDLHHHHHHHHHYIRDDNNQQQQVLQSEA